MADPSTTERQRWMSVLARASAAEIEQQLIGCDALPDHTRLRGPELGLLMVRGRTGGGGAPFNAGEMTMARCTVRAGGHTGHAYVGGRDLHQAELAAVLDAALQDPARTDRWRGVIDRLAEAQAARRDAMAAKAAATRVQFFTMATMRG